MQREQEQQKFKLGELRTKISINTDLKNLYTRLRSDHNGVQDELEEIKKHLKETFAKTFQEIEEAYTVSENILERIKKLEVNENRRQDSGVLWMIKEGIKRLAQLAWNFFLGRITGYLE